MSNNDMLGSVVRILVLIPMKYFGAILDLLEKLQGRDGERWYQDLTKFLRGELYSSKRWTEKDGVIYFTITSNGKTGDDWITHFEGKKLPVGSYAQSVLRHKNFKPTKAGTVHNITVLKGELFSDEDRITKNIRAEAKKRKMTDPHAEVACLIRDAFSNKEIEEMGLSWIITMHEPIPDSDGDPSVLGARGSGDYELDACRGILGSSWNRDGGFAFSASQP
jgi:hypothetical protein